MTQESLLEIIKQLGLRLPHFPRATRRDQGARAPQRETSSEGRTVQGRRPGGSK